jgi:hypothetical protein
VPKFEPHEILFCCLTLRAHYAPQMTIS